MTDRSRSRGTSRHRGLGDWPTPPELVRTVLARLLRNGAVFERVLEPSCGSGSFIEGLLGWPVPPPEIVGVEVQEAHCRRARALPLALGTRVAIVHGDVFQLDLRRLPFTTSGRLLVVGNPPWVTVSALGAGAASPARSNSDALPGFAALTGASNFDLAESLWLQVLTQLAGECPTVALLCKLETARRVLEAAAARRLPVAAAEICLVDGRRAFGIAASACLLTVDLAREPAPGWSARVPIFADPTATAPRSFMGLTDAGWVADLAAHDPALAASEAPLEWRQGVKHDAAPILELRSAPAGDWVNGLGAPVEVEACHRYPLLKATHLHRGETQPTRQVLVTQFHLSAPTDALATEAPRLWAYLGQHRDRLDARRSRVYEGRPPFAMFGVGPYAFAPFKVAVSGLHRAARFRALGPEGGRPILLDDTCYYAPLETAAQAALLAAVLSSEPARRFLDSLAPAGAKRPITQARLRRLDPAAVLRQLDWPALLDAAAVDLARLEPGADAPTRALEAARVWLSGA